ncbi:hypothetical protein FB451DRAFT_1143508 [Mycena latifolia]|nr:hypothetical protein FB451DRAFT_1143508 [Mycena latifolia]
MDTDSTGESTQRDSGLTRAEGLWFEDCGLIIQAERRIFRVSRDVIAIQSPVFHDMLSLPTPSDADTMYGCPFVILPDSAADVDAFLRALFYYDFFEPYPARTTFPILSSVLRMSHKYAVDPLRKRALVQLSSAHPTTLEGWELLAVHLPSWDPPTGDENILILQLARQLSADWILPSAFYRFCGDCDEAAIIIGCDHYALSTPDKIRCVKAIRELETTATAAVVEFLWSAAGAEACGSPVQCVVSRHEVRQMVEAWRSGPLRALPLRLWEDNDWERFHTDVCADCIASLKSAHLEARFNLWDRLPEIFGLPNWTELEKMKAEALA